MKKILISCFLLYFIFCQQSRDITIPEEKIHFYDFPFSLSLKWKYFLWEFFYQKKFHKITKQIAKEIVQQLPWEVQIGQIIHTGISGTRINPEIIKHIKKYHIGGIILFKSNIKNQQQLLNLISNLQHHSYQFSQIPIFFSTDQEGGKVKRITHFVSEFPGAMAIGQTENPYYAWLVGFITGYELHQLGIPIIFAPVADINNNPYNPVINIRSFGTYEPIVSKMVTHYVQGMAPSGALNFLKHFPGHGDTHIDSHYDLPVIFKTLKELKQLELKPFYKGIQANANGIMIAHILYPKIDSYPSTLSKKIITELLIKEMNFRGLIITDAMEMKAISNRYTIEKAALFSFLSGVDIILLTAQNQNVIKVYNMLRKHIKGKKILMDRLKSSVQKQIQYKLYSGIWEKDRLIKSFDIQSDLLNEYFYILQYRKNLSKKIYKQIKLLYPDLEFKIVYDSIRSLHKVYPELPIHNIKNIYFFYSSHSRNINWIQQKNFSKLHLISLPKKKIYTVYKKIQQDDIMIWDLQSFQEWKAIQSLHKKIQAKRIIYFYTGNPFLKIQLKENQYWIVSFSLTKYSYKAMLKKILEDEIPKAKLILP